MSATSTECRARIVVEVEDEGASRSTSTSDDVDVVVGSVGRRSSSAARSSSTRSSAARSSSTRSSAARSSSTPSSAARSSSTRSSAARSSSTPSSAAPSSSTRSSAARVGRRRGWRSDPHRQARGRGARLGGRLRLDRRLDRRLRFDRRLGLAGGRRFRTRRAGLWWRRLLRFSDDLPSERRGSSPTPPSPAALWSSSDATVVGGRGTGDVVLGRMTGNRSSVLSAPSAVNMNRATMPRTTTHAPAVAARIAPGSCHHGPGGGSYSGSNSHSSSGGSQPSSSITGVAER